MGCSDPFKEHEELVLLRATRDLLLGVIASDALAFATTGAVQLMCVWVFSDEEVWLERIPTFPRRVIDPARIKASRSDFQALLVEYEVHMLCQRLYPEICQQHPIRDASDAIPVTTGRMAGSRSIYTEDHLTAF